MTPTCLSTAAACGEPDVRDKVGRIVWCDTAPFTSHHALRKQTNFGPREKARSARLLTETGNRKKRLWQRALLQT